MHQFQAGATSATVGTPGPPCSAGRREATTVALVMGAVLAAATGCQGVPRQLALRPDVGFPESVVHVFFVDGLQRAALHEMLAAGALPNLQRLFVDEGIVVDPVLSCTPTVTYANTVTLLTGLHPGLHGVMGNQWFDPRSLEFHDYATAFTYTAVNDDFTTATLHEQITEGWTASIKCPTSRGADWVQNRPISTGLAWLREDYSAADRQSAADIRGVVREANRRREWPRLICQYFPGVDETAHAYGPDDPRYRDALRNVDAAIGAVVQAVEDSPAGAVTRFAVVTDHSHTFAPPERRVDLRAALVAKTGLRIHTGVIAGDDRMGRARPLRDVDVVMTRANRVAHFHVRPEAGWDRAERSPVAATAEDAAGARQGATGSTGYKPVSHLTVRPARVSGWAGPDPVILQRLKDGLTGIPLVGLIVAPQEGDGCLVRSARGSAILRYREWRGVWGFACEAVVGDPFGYAGTPAAAVQDGLPHAADEWLKATRETEYPEAVPQILQMMRGRGAGHVVAFAAPNASFLPHEPSGHGSPHASDAYVAFLFRGPRSALDAARDIRRLTDFAPWVLGQLRFDQSRVAW